MPDLCREEYSGFEKCLTNVPKTVPVGMPSQVKNIPDVTLHKHYLGSSAPPEHFPQHFLEHFLEHLFGILVWKACHLGT